MLRAFDEATVPTLPSRKESPAPPNSSFVEPTDVERRIEDWLVCYLDDCDPRQEEPSLLDLLDAGTLAKQPDQNRRRASSGPKRRPAARQWARITARRFRSIVFVRLLDQMLIKANVIEELAEDLGDLLRAGCRRIVLNFANVERLSSQIVGLVAEAHRLCSQTPGGLLKLCGLRPEVSEVFALAGFGGILPIAADEVRAFEGPWPSQAATRPLPVSILAALTGPAAGPDRAPDATEQERTAPGERASAVPPASPPNRRACVRLRVEGGRHAGTLIPVRGTRFRIGREASCQLRSRSTLLSRLHAVLERRSGGEVILRDLGSTNGTLVNGRLIRNESVTLTDGDRLKIGPLMFVVTIDPALDDPAVLEDLVVSWIADGSDSSGSAAETAPTVEIETTGSLFGDDEAVSSETDLPGFRMRFEVVQDVLVVTPTARRLDEDAVIDLLRLGLAELAQRDLPKKVVLNFESVTHLSSRAIGVLLAHYLRLGRDGGALRLCQLHARVLSVLEQFRLPMLLEAFTTVDEATIADWD